MRVVLDLLQELTNTRIFGLFHNCMWQSRYSEVNVYFLELCGRIEGLFTSNKSHHTNWYSCSQERNVYRFPEHSNATSVLSQRVSSFYKLD